MFTAIIISEDSRRLIEPWRELFVPFEARGDIAFCTWNTGRDAVSLEQAVPELPKAVKGHREWRAIILLGPSEGSPFDDTSGPRNPFDYSPMAAAQASQVWTHSPWPLIRLTHMLLGLPELGPKGFAADPSFQDPSTRETVYLSSIVKDFEAAGMAGAREEFNRRAQLSNHPRIRYRAIPPSPEESESHHHLAEHYGPHQVMPDEVLLLAPQVRRRQRPMGLLQDQWADASAAQASRFVERNAYPPSCRFLTFEMDPNSHVEADLQEMKLVLGLLTLATNDLPASGLQAERLYRLGLEVDSTALAGVLNQHMWQLIDLRQRIEARLEQAQRPLTSSTVEALLEASPISVDMGLIDGNGLTVPLNGYGLASDTPVDGIALWIESAASLRSAADAFARQPPRALRRAVSETRTRMAKVATEPEVLSELDVEELEVELAQRSEFLVEPADGDIVDGRRLSSLIERYDSSIRRALRERMPSRTIRLAGLVVLAAWSLALLPYILAAAFDGTSNAIESLLVSLILLTTVGVVGLLTLVVMKRRFIALLRSLNLELRGLVSQVNEGAHRYATFLTGIATYTRGRRTLIADQQRLATLSLEQRRLRGLREWIDTRIDAEKSIVRSIGRAVQIERPEGFRTELHSPEDALEALMWTPGRTPCMFNSSGDTIVAPYPFVTRLTVEDAGIREAASRLNGDDTHHTTESPQAPPSNTPDHEAL